MQTIYVDVLIILNVYVNFFLLRITAAVTRSPMSSLRCLFASFYGSLFSLLIVAPELPFLLNLLIKSTAAVTVVAAAFGIRGKARLIKNTAAFFSANFILAGGVYGVYSWFKPQMMHFANSYFYIDFSLIILIISTAAMYLLVNLIRRITDRTLNDEFRLILNCRGRVIALDAVSDTGNVLTDLFSGRPVVICGRDDLGGELSDVSPEVLPRGFRLMPVATVSDSGLLPIFKPDEALLVNTSSGERKPVDIMVGIGENNGKAVFNPKLLK